VAAFFDRADNKRWLPDWIGKFSLSSTYQFLQNRVGSTILPHS
ncbi:hypothetical protein A2U01_0090108, partial [Trifolium medium]|nr:hypothetical protein [Trifolium medium]